MIVFVIGGGPAGMIAAANAAQAGHAVTLIERNEKLGKKTLYHWQRPLQRNEHGRTRFFFCARAA
jgi:NADPH-dependent 2,4-dienoyl-CoA reductase/sulfur reductase-like enzyme